MFPGASSLPWHAPAWPLPPKPGNDRRYRDVRPGSYECDAPGAVELNLLLAKWLDALPPAPIWPIDSPAPSQIKELTALRGHLDQLLAAIDNHEEEN